MASIRDSVRVYLAEGWPVVAIMRGKKRPEDNNWIKHDYTAEEFSEDHNIGIKLGNGLADIDLDCKEAVTVAAALMPETRVHGRSGKPASHYWFRCGVEPYQYKDLDGSMLMEIRSASNLQTVVPPSMHPSGEQLRWENTSPAMEIDREDLLRAVRATAIATLFGRHWPAGSRHVASGHLAGFLLRLGFDGPWTQEIVRMAATVGGDDEISDRVRMAKDTVAKHMRGEKTTGGPKLTESFGNAELIMERCYQWMQREGDAKLDMLNEQHFVAFYGGDTIVATPKLLDTREQEGEHASALEVQTFEAFRRRYYNQYVGKQRLGEWWLSHPKQRRFRRIVFAPPPRFCHPEDYNLWRGFTVEPDTELNPENRCGRFLAHLYSVICDGNDDYYNYALDFFALTCQFPGKPIERVFVMQGDSGSGKGTVVKLFWDLFYPDQCIQVDKADAIVGRFNAGMSGKVIVFADEAVWGGNKSQAGALRRIVTEPGLAIEKKGIDITTEPNCVHLFMASNEEWVWPATIKERRGFLLHVRLKKFQTAEYWEALHQEWRNGGKEAFLAVCLNRKVPGDRMGPIPGTATLAEQQSLSLDTIHQWWISRLQGGTLGIDDSWPRFVSTKWLMDDFYAYARARQARGGRAAEMEFAATFEKFGGEDFIKTRRQCEVNVREFGEDPFLVKRRAWGYDLPSLADCRANFDTYVGTPQKWNPLDEDTPLPLEDANANF